MGLIPGEIRSIAEVIPSSYKIPHIGWNALSFPADRPKCPLFREVKEGDYVYFVHSFHAVSCPDVIATTDYGGTLTAAVAHDNVFGMQFHPEKSGEVGLSILRAFAEL